MRYFCFSSPKQWLGSLLQIAIYIAALVGIVQMMAAFTGNETVQPFRSLQNFRSDLMKTRYQTLTGEVRNENSPETHWQAFQHTQALRWAINPELLFGWTS